MYVRSVSKKTGKLVFVSDRGARYAYLLLMLCAEMHRREHCGRASFVLALLCLSCLFAVTLLFVAIAPSVAEFHPYIRLGDVQ